MPCLQTANVFLAKAEGQAWTASACDYQWIGGGLGVRDVVYLIWTSVRGSVQTSFFTALCMLTMSRPLCHPRSLVSASAGKGPTSRHIIVQLRAACLS